MNQAPVAYIVFNRPRHTRKTFEVLRKQRPETLFIIADGPRKNHSTDETLCREVREIVAHVDWPCEVFHNYADANLGLKQRVSSGLDWVFSKVERAIVLEDDCLAHPEFFTFCEELLERYAEDERISTITGNNFQDGHRRGNGSYYFSNYNHCWGWATWRRAWKFYQGDIAFWPEWSRTMDWCAKVPDSVERRYWKRIFSQVSAGKVDSWAYPWTASIWHKGGLTATPNGNLVSNIGFGGDSTHTADIESPLAAITTVGLGDLVHPEQIERNIEADAFVFDRVYGGSSLRSVSGILKCYARMVYQRLKHLAAN